MRVARYGLLIVAAYEAYTAAVTHNWRYAILAGMLIVFVILTSSADRGRS